MLTRSMNWHTVVERECSRVRSPAAQQRAAEELVTARGWPPASLQDRLPGLMTKGVVEGLLSGPPCAGHLSEGQVTQQGAAPTASGARCAELSSVCSGLQELE